MEGYLASVFIGISLGLIGGGGSVLTVPVLVYLFKVDAVSGTAYSLFIVGATSAVGSLSYFKKGLINIRMAIFFGIPSIAAVFLTRAYIVPAIPQEILRAGSFIITKNILLMLLFAVLMIFASYSMIKKHRQADDMPRKGAFNRPLVFMEGIFTGAVTGLVGAGGGFLIIPALVNLLGLPMKIAVGTSLLIISINSLAGFLFSLSHTAVQWPFLLMVTFISIAGVLIGSFLSSKIDGKKLKPAFGWFVLLMGVYIIIKETVLN